MRCCRNQIETEADQKALRSTSWPCELAYPRAESESAGSWSRTHILASKLQLTN